MPVPKRKVSRCRRDSRQANKGITPKGFYLCPECTAPLSPHQACMTCGYYKGRKIFSTSMDRALVRTSAKAAIQETKASKEAASEVETK